MYSNTENNNWEITLTAKFHRIQIRSGTAALRCVPAPSSVKTIDCIKEMDVTSMTSPIGLWTAARKPIVSNLGSAILKILGACWEKQKHRFYLYGHEAGPWAEQEGCDWLRGLDLEDIGQSTCQSGRSHTLIHTLLYRQIYNFTNEHHTALKKALN